MKKTLLITLLGFFSFYGNAQTESAELEFTTYYAEKAKFRIDIPDKWSTGVSEVKALMGYTTSIVSFDAQEPGTHLIIMSLAGCKGPANEAKGYKKIFEKTAKKSKDAAFRIVDEGEEKDQDGKNYYWIDFIHTLELEDGSKIVLRELFVARCHYAGMSKFANTFRFQTAENNWDKNKPIFDQVYATARFE